MARLSPLRPTEEMRMQTCTIVKVLYFIFTAFLLSFFQHHSVNTSQYAEDHAPVVKHLQCNLGNPSVLPQDEVHRDGAEEEERAGGGSGAEGHREDSRGPSL